VSVRARGAPSASLWSLVDGSITVSILATDTAGNTAGGSGDTLTLDTSADPGTALSLTVSDSSINNAEKTAAGFTVAGLDADASADVTFTDAASHQVTVHVTGNGASSADLSSLAHGTITVTTPAPTI